VNPQALLQFFKALSDANRLRIVGLLAHRPYAVEELATVLELRPSTISHHLRRLGEAGLVEGRVQGHYHLYALDEAGLQRRAKALGAIETFRAASSRVDGLDPFDARVLDTFVDDKGRVTQLPKKRKKFQVLLRFALRSFEDDGPWDEREVNRRLKRITDDTASFRRGFIDHSYMTREPGGRRYRRTAR